MKESQPSPGPAIKKNQAMAELDKRANKLRQETTRGEKLETQLSEARTRVKNREDAAATAAAAVTKTGATNERYNRNLIEASLDPLVVIDRNGKISDVNIATETVTGCSRTKLIGTDFSDYFTEPDKARQSYQEVLSKSLIRNYPLTIKHKSGRLTDVLYNASLYKNEAGVIRGVFAAVRDITEQKKAEVSTSLLSEVVRNMSEGACLIKQADDTIVYTNPKFEEMFGYGPEEMIGKHVSIVNAPTDKTPEETNEDILSVLEKTGEWHGEVKNIRKDGTPFWCHANVSTFDHPEYGKVYVTTHNEITERRQAEEQLRNSEARYRTIVENVNDALIIHDFKGRIIDVNENACRLLGYTRKELVGANLKMINSEESNKLIQKNITRIIADGAVVFESHEVRKDGNTIPVEISAKLVSTEGAGLVQAFVRDITHRRAAEKEQAKSYKKLKTILDGTVKAITAISDTRDPYTSGHETRVSKLVVAIATEMGLPKDEIEELRIISVLHDIGKVYVPSEILNKPGRLTDIEFSLVKTHARVGYDIIKEAALPCNIASTILQHHERFDGSGYPEGIKKDKIGLDARILAVADVVEAMSSHRPYRPALGIDAALQEIEKNKGKLYAPEIVDICVKLFREKAFRFSE